MPPIVFLPIAYCLVSVPFFVCVFFVCAYCLLPIVYRGHAAANEATGRRPKKTVIDGVRWAQARFIRVMHSHWRRSKGKSDRSECLDDFTDVQVKQALAALADANDLEINIDEVDDAADAAETALPSQDAQVEETLVDSAHEEAIPAAQPCQGLDSQVVLVSSDEDAMGW